MLDRALICCTHVASSYLAFRRRSRHPRRIHATWEGSMNGRPEIDKVAGWEIIRRGDGMFGVYDCDGKKHDPSQLRSKLSKLQSYRREDGGGDHSQADLLSRLRPRRRWRASTGIRGPRGVAREPSNTAGPHSLSFAKVCRRYSLVAVGRSREWRVRGTGGAVSQGEVLEME